MSSGLRRRALLPVAAGVAVVGGAWLVSLGKRVSEYGWAGLTASNPLIGRKLPEFAASGLPPQPGFATTDVAAAGRPALLNFFASWCVPCLLEMPMLRSLAQQGLPIWGIAYRDRPEDAAGFLRRVNAPYRHVGLDPSGDAGAAFGVDAVPQSFLVDRDGIIRWGWSGELSSDVVRQDLQPMLSRLASTAQN